MPEDAHFSELFLREIQPGDKLTGLSLGRAEFTPLKAFLRNDAIDFHSVNVARTYVIVDEDSRVWAYITLMCSQIEIDEDCRPGECEGASKYKDFPAIKIARLAVDSKLQRKWMGTSLVDWAISTVKRVIMPTVGCRFLIVDAKPCSVPFYKRLGFSGVSTDDAEDNDPVLYIDLHVTE